MYETSGRLIFCWTECTKQHKVQLTSNNTTLAQTLFAGPHIMQYNLYYTKENSAILVFLLYGCIKMWWQQWWCDDRDFSQILNSHTGENKECSLLGCVRLCSRVMRHKEHAAAILGVRIYHTTLNYIPDDCNLRINLFLPPVSVCYTWNVNVKTQQILTVLFIDTEK